MENRLSHRVPPLLLVVRGEGFERCFAKRTDRRRLRSAPRRSRRSARRLNRAAQRRRSVPCNGHGNPRSRRTRATTSRMHRIACRRALDASRPIPIRDRAEPARPRSRPVTRRGRRARPCPGCPSRCPSSRRCPARPGPPPAGSGAVLLHQPPHGHAARLRIVHAQQPSGRHRLVGIDERPVPARQHRRHARVLHAHRERLRAVVHSPMPGGPRSAARRFRGSAGRRGPASSDTFQASGTGSLAAPARSSWNTKNPLSASSHSDVSSPAIESTAGCSSQLGSGLVDPLEYARAPFVERHVVVVRGKLVDVLDAEDVAVLATVALRHPRLRVVPDLAEVIDSRQDNALPVGTDGDVADVDSMGRVHWWRLCSSP